MRVTRAHPTPSHDRRQRDACRSRRGGGRRDPPLVFTEDRPDVESGAACRNARRRVGYDRKHRSTAHTASRASRRIPGNGTGNVGAPGGRPWRALIGDRVLFAGGLDAAGASTARVGSVQGSSVRSLANLPRALHRRRERDARGRARPVRRRRRGSESSTASSASTRRERPRRSRRCPRCRPTRWPWSSATPRTSSVDTTVPMAGHDRRVHAGIATGSRRAPSGRAALRGRRQRERCRRHRGWLDSGQSRCRARSSRFDPTTARVTKVGDLPTALTHASAAGSGGVVVVAGGQDSARAPLASILDDRSRHRNGAKRGTLATPRSDAGFTKAGAELVLVGGKGAKGALATVSALTSDAGTPPTSAPPTNVYVHDGANMLNPEQPPRCRASTCRTASRTRSTSSTRRRTRWSTTSQSAGFRSTSLPHGMRRRSTSTTTRATASRRSIRARATPGTPIAVADPYNLYFTTDGKYAIVVAEALGRLDFRDASQHAVSQVGASPVPRRGSHGFHRRRQPRARQLRVLGRDARCRSRGAERAREVPTAAPTCEAAGCEALAGRDRVLRRRHASERAVGDRRGDLRGAGHASDRQRRARPVSEPRRVPRSTRAIATRHRQRHRFRDPEGRRYLENSRRQPRHGRSIGRRRSAMALGSFHAEVYAISTPTSPRCADGFRPSASVGATLRAFAQSMRLCHAHPAPGRCATVPASFATGDVLKRRRVAADEFVGDRDAASASITTLVSAIAERLLAESPRIDVPVDRASRRDTVAFEEEPTSEKSTSTRGTCRGHLILPRRTIRPAVRIVAIHETVAVEREHRASAAL